MLNNLREKKWNCILDIYTIIMAFVCVGSSPFLDYMDPDSQNFWLIGRSLANGQVAYRDIFDHKGPYLYFIELFAAKIGGESEWGLFILECLFLLVNVNIVYQLCFRYLKSEKKSFLCTISFLGISLNFFTFVTGNLTDTYAVTFQLISIILIIKYFEDNGQEHPPIYMFIHGVCASATGLMRPTNAAMWIPFGIVLAGWLFKNKLVKNFIYNFIALLGGVIFALIPVFIYGVKHDLLEDIWYGTVVANMEYTANNLETRNVIDFIKGLMVRPEFLIIALCLLSIVVVFKTKDIKFILKLSYATMLLFSLIISNISLRPNGQYNHLCVVFTLPVIIFFFNLLGSKAIVKVWLPIIIACTLLVNLQLIKQIVKYGVFDSYYRAASEMADRMELTADSKVIVTGCHSVFYNVTNTLPHIKYFITYGGGLDYSVFPDATLMQKESICSGENDYIIAVYDNNGTLYGVDAIEAELQEYFDQNCEMIYEQNDSVRMVLYKD